MLREIFLMFAGYAVGCFPIGYYLVRLHTGGDIRNVGSGSAGATNVGRKLGAWAFSATLILDAAKGAAAAAAAFYFAADPAAVMLTVAAVVGGHIWPAQLAFRGGKGIAPALGGILVFDYRLGILTLLLVGIICLFTRRFTLSGLLAAMLSPGLAYSLGHSGRVLLYMSALVLFILISHRSNIRTIVAGTDRQAVG